MMVKIFFISSVFQHESHSEIFVIFLTFKTFISFRLKLLMFQLFIFQRYLAFYNK